MHTKNQNLLLILLCSLALGSSARAQTTLDQYIKIGIDSNLALRQHHYNLELARIDLQRARALFYPSAAFNSQYELAQGGRTIELPIGDLLNGVYSTLNEITSSHKFPAVQNQTVQFLPNNFQDTRVDVSLPLYNPSLFYNKQIKQGMVQSQEVEVRLYKRELIFQIKEAFYQYLQASQALSIYESALATVQENLRFNEKLFKNHVATEEPVLKAKAQVSQVLTNMALSNKDKSQAAAYFNFLLNRPLSCPIDLDPSIHQGLDQNLGVTESLPTNREELVQIKTAQQIIQANTRLDETYKLPALNGFYQVGFQGFGYQFDHSQFYQFGGLQLTWNLFKGNDHRLKVKGDQIQLQAMEDKYQEASQQILLQIRNVQLAYQAAWEVLRNAQDEVLSTQEAFRMAERRYQNGQALQIEWIDARTQMTTAALRRSLAELAVLSKAAELERALATADISKF